MNEETRETSKDRERARLRKENWLTVLFIGSGLLAVSFLSAAAWVSQGLIGVLIVWGVAFMGLAFLSGVALGNS